MATSLTARWFQCPVCDLRWNTLTVRGGDPTGDEAGMYFEDLSSDCALCGQQTFAQIELAMPVTGDENGAGMYAEPEEEEDDMAEVLSASFSHPQPAPAPVGDPADLIRDAEDSLPVGGGFSCAICLDEEHGGMAELKACGHRFHRECISRWLASGGRACPLCKADVVVMP